MLKHLYVKNFTLIDVLDIDFEGGFSVITGETGAGKSIILGAIGLLLGQRADSKTVKGGGEKCVIEAHFDLSRYEMKSFFEENEIDYDAEDTIVRRELTPQGKSRAFINDTPVALNLLKELGEQLVDVHSQHQNLLLGKHDFQLSVVDILAKDQQPLTEYQAAFARYQQLAQQLRDTIDKIEQSRKETDFLQFQYDELSAARLCDGEQEELEQRSETMAHSEEIKSALYEAQTAFDGGDGEGIIASLRRATQALRGIERVLPDAAELAERMESSYIELKDVAAETGSLLENVDFDPQELERVNVRLDKIYDLQKKYHAETVGELIQQKDRLGQLLNNIENSDETIGLLKKEVYEQECKCRQWADKLSALRQQAARQIEKEMQQRLVPLGMPHVRFQVSISRETELGRYGQDRVAFLFSANTSTPLQSVAQVASGGEIARVMLSLKALISGAVKLPTIIFDEIDTGVSGKIAEQMAQVMAEMGRQDRQVISITHLPQIAALGQHHYKVYKDETSRGTTSHMQQLTGEQRVSEIAQMLSGSDVSEAAMENARQLLRSSLQS